MSFTKKISCTYFSDMRSSLYLFLSNTSFSNLPAIHNQMSQHKYSRDLHILYNCCNSTFFNAPFLYNIVNIILFIHTSFYSWKITLLKGSTQFHQQHHLQCIQLTSTTAADCGGVQFTGWRRSLWLTGAHHRHNNNDHIMEQTGSNDITNVCQVTNITTPSGEQKTYTLK